MCLIHLVVVWIFKLKGVLFQHHQHVHQFLHPVLHLAAHLPAQVEYLHPVLLHPVVVVHKTVTAHLTVILQIV